MTFVHRINNTNYRVKITNDILIPRSGPFYIFDVIYVKI